MLRWLNRKPKVTDADPVRRLQAVQALDIAEQAALAGLARDDADQNVRAAAMARLQAPQLGALLQEAEARSDRQAAFAIAERLAALGGEHAFVEHPLVMVAVCVQSPSPDRLAAIADADLAAFAIARVADAATRRALAEALWSEARLAALEAQTRNRDKALHRFAKERLAQRKRLQQDRAGLLERAESLIAAAQRLLPAEPRFAARRSALQQEWDAVCRSLDENAAALEPFGIAADAALRDRFRLPESASAPPERAAAALSTPEALLAELAALQPTLLAALDAPDNIASVNERLSAVVASWNRLAAAASPPAAAAGAYREGRSGLRELLEAATRANARRAEADRILACDARFHEPRKDEDYAALWQRQTACRRAARNADALLEDVAWPAAAPAPAWLGDLARHAAALRAVDDRCHAVFEALQQEIADAAAAMEARAEAGEVNEALRLRAQANQCIRRLPKPAQDGLAGKLANRSARLRELVAWQSFAERGKREALCEKMEALAAEPLATAAQFERIKALRRDLQALGHPRSGPDRALLERFDAAADRAFEPCRKHFEALAEQRRFNLAQRETICRELEGFVERNDWSQADYKGVEQILRKAREEWAEYRPVDRGPGKQLDARFKAVTERLHGHLRADWERNVAAKEAIVARARGALASERPAAELVDLLKALQRDWQALGPTPRRKDQALWKAFRQICDEVFGARNAEREARRTKAGSTVAEANALIETLRGAMLEDAADVPDRRMLGEYRERAEALDRLPREVDKRLQRALSDFEREVALAAGRRRVQVELERIERLEALDAQLAELERERADLAAWREQAGDLAAAFEARLAGATPADASALKTLVIEAEIAAQVESPPADKAQRMALRMQGLRSGLGSGGQDWADAAELLDRWCAGASGAAATAALRTRFFASVRRIAQG